MSSMATVAGYKAVLLAAAALPKMFPMLMTAAGLGTQVGVLLPFSRKHESEADHMGLIFMAMAGYDPRVSVVFWERMMANSEGAMPEFLSTHPHPENRIKYLESKMDKAMAYYNASQAQ